MKKAFIKVPFLVSIFLVLAGITFVVWDVYTPHKDNWAPSSFKGQDVMQASGLVLQYQGDDDVWATRGYSIYRSQKGKPFEKITTIRPRLGLAWLGYSSTLRAWTGHQELTEVVPLSSGQLVVFASGDIYRVDPSTKAQHRVHQLRGYGIGKGRGVLANGIALDAEGSIYYGEYTRLRKNETVRLYRSTDEGRTWQVAFEFEPAEVKHIHTVRWDPLAKAIWIGTGDTDSQSRIGISYDGGRNFRWIGQNSQHFRTVNLMFFDDKVVWVTDTNIPESRRALSWNRHENRIDVGTQILPAPAYYSLKLSENSGIVTLSEQELSVWTIDDQRRMEKLLEWPIKEINISPSPTIRLPRGSVADSRWTYLNPLRTSMADAIIYRVPKSLLMSERTKREIISNDMEQR